MPEVILESNGRHIPISSAQILHSMYALSAGFELELLPMTDFPQPGNACTLWLGNQVLLKGYIDTLGHQITASKQGLRITGRDKTGDLVDCHLPLRLSELYGLTVDSLIAELIEPFDIDLIATTDFGEPIPVFSTQPSETVFNAIQRACNYRSLVCYSNRIGQLLLTDIGNTKATTVLTEGKNILQANFETSHLERFSEYKLIGQLGRWIEGATYEYTVAQTRDEAVKRYRPWLGLADMAMDDGLSEQRIQWEKAVRVGRSQNLEVTVVGWQQSNGSLWQINQEVSVMIQSWNLQTSFIASQVCLQFHPQQGWRTQLELTPRAALHPAPVNEPLSLLQQLL